jgi:RNA polymerase sigma factor (sigma-70 family)
MSNTLSTHEMKLFRAGNKSVFDKVYNKYYRKFCDYSFSIIKDHAEARAIGNVSFVKLWGAKEQFKEEEDLKKFLFIVVKNASLNYLKQQKARGNPVELKDNLPMNADDLIKKYEETEIIQKVSDMIEKMPGKYGKVLNLLFCKKKDPQEVADQLNMSLNSVAQHKKYGLKKLMKFFGRE